MDAGWPRRRLPRCSIARITINTVGFSRNVRGGVSPVGRNFMQTPSRDIHFSYLFKDDGEGRWRRCEKHRGGLRVRRLICQCADEVEARLVWSSDPRATSYNVTWREDSCETWTSIDEPPKSSKRISGWRVTDVSRFVSNNILSHTSRCRFFNVARQPYY